MNLLTLAKLKPVVARALKKCATDADVVTFINEAQERLLNRPNNPVGSMMRYRFCTDDVCIVLPRQVRTVLKGAWCNTPAKILSQWYEFDNNGPGILESTSFVGEAIVDHGTDCKFDDLTVGATDRLLRITTDIAETAGTYIWLYGYDENNQWIQTQYGGTWYDGERVDLGSTPANTTHYFTRLTRVHKDVTNGIVRVYEWDSVAAAVVKQLGQYEPSEEDPIYRRVMLPGKASYGDCTSCGSTTSSTSSACGDITASCLTMSTGYLLGRTAMGSGAVQTIQVGAGLSLAGGVLTGTGGVEEAPEDGTPYARQDAGWVALAGGGDMLKATYDADNNGVVDDAEHAQSLTLTCVDDATAHVVRCRLDQGNYVLEIVQ